MKLYLLLAQFIELIIQGFTDCRVIALHHQLMTHHNDVIVLFLVCVESFVEVLMRRQY